VFERFRQRRSEERRSLLRNHEDTRATKNHEEHRLKKLAEKAF